MTKSDIERNIVLSELTTHVSGGNAHQDDVRAARLWGNGLYRRMTKIKLNGVLHRQKLRMRGETQEELDARMEALLLSLGGE